MMYYQKTNSYSSSGFTRVIAGIVTATFLFFVINGHIAKSKPQSHKQDVWKTQVAPLLKKTSNDFSLKSEFSIIPQSYAGSLYQDAAAYAVIDFDSGDIIAQKELSKPLPIASLTKIMTAVVTLDLMNPSEQITISKRASEEVPTKIGVAPGEKMTVEELLNATLLTSANDAAGALRDGADAKYGGPVFIKAMNEKAAFLGLKHSSFTNPQGFDNTNHYSTVEDLAILSHYALQNYPVISEIVKKDYQFLPANQYHKQFDLQNWNGLIGVYPNTTGIKIGNTDDAGKTTVVLSERNGKRVLAVVLGAPGVLERDMWASQLLDVGFETILDLPPVNVTEEQFQAKYDSWVYY